MNTDHNELILQLRQKIKTILTLYESQKSSNADLLQTNKELTEKVLVLENKLSDTNKKYENLKIAKTLSSVPGEGTHDTKLQVNKIVREIDKCIALLNR